MSALNLAVSLSPLAVWIVFASAKCVAVIVLVFVSRRILNPWLSAQARHRLWYAVIACLVVPFGVQTEILSFDNRSPFAAEIHRESGGEAPSTIVRTQIAQSSEQASSSGTSGMTNVIATPTSAPIASASTAMPSLIWPTTILVWLAVVVALSIVTLWNLVVYFRMTSGAAEADPVVAKLFVRCKQQLDVRRDVRLLVASQISSPAVFGWWSPVLLLPQGFDKQLSKDQLRHVFLHELAHVQRQDILVNWLTTIAQIVHWFNPFVWYGLRTMRADMEQACDAKVMSCLSQAERRDYGDTLIKLTDFYPQSRTRMLGLAQGAGIVEDHAQLKRRIQMIAQFSSKRIKHSLFATLALTAITSVALTQPVISSRSKVDSASIDSASINSKIIRDTPALATASGRYQSFEPVAARALALAATPAHATPPATQSAQKKLRVAQANPTAEKTAQTATQSSSPKADAVGDVKTSANDVAPKYGVPIEQLIAQVAEKTHKKFIVDPRVRGYVQVIGQNTNQIDYPGLLTILRVHNFAGVEVNGYVNVVPISEARNFPNPRVVEGKDYPDDQWMSINIHAKNVCVASLMQMLRPLIPQYAHMGVESSSNSLLVVDTFANLKKIESIIKDIDARSTSNGQCGEKALK